MAKDNSLLFIVGLGAVAWYGYTQGWLGTLSVLFSGQSPPTPGGTSSGGTTTTTTACAAPNTLVNGVCTPPATSPANPPTITQYNGPGATTAAQAQLANNLATAAQQAGAGANGLNVDQWAYYYATIPGPSVTIPNPAPPYTGTITVPGNPMPLSGSQVGAILQAAGASGANRSTVLMTAPQFVNLLSTAGGVAGLSGFGQVGYARRIPVPVLLMNRGRGFGRYDLGDLRRAGGR